MMRARRSAVAALAAVAVGVSSACAQVPYNLNYDYYPRTSYTPLNYQLYGWSGWGVPPQMQQNVASAMGIYAQNAARSQAALQQTQAAARLAQVAAKQAQAAAQEKGEQQKKSDMISRWNTFYWSVHHAYNLLEVGGALPEGKTEAAKLENELTRVRDQPKPDEIESGAALNALLDQLTDPRLPPQAMHGSPTPLSPALIRAIPYDYNSVVIAILLDRMTSDARWPKTLNLPPVTPLREAFRTKVEAAIEEGKAGPLSEATVSGVHGALKQLALKLLASLPKDSALATSTEGYLKELTGIARLLGRPDIGPVLAALDDKTSATVEDLLGFMQMFNLRFGASSTAAQKAAYRKLYPILAQFRTAVLKRAGKRPPRASVTLKELRKEAAPALMIFAAMTWEQLLGHPPEVTPAEGQR